MVRKTDSTLDELKKLHKATEKETGLLKHVNRKLRQRGTTLRIKYIDLPDEGGDSAGVIKTFKKLAESEGLKTKISEAGFVGRVIIAYTGSPFGLKYAFEVIEEAAGE